MQMIKFSENMISVLQLAANPHKTFNLSKIDKKKETNKFSVFEPRAKRPEASLHLTFTV